MSSDYQDRHDLNDEDNILSIHSMTIKDENKDDDELSNINSNNSDEFKDSK